MDELLVIRGDMQGLDRYGRVRLSTSDALEDIAKYADRLRVGLVVLIEEDAYVHAQAALDYLKEENIWVASPLWSTFEDRTPP